jgi:hypothetical protein
LPHRDYTFTDSHCSQGKPKILTMWVPVTEVTPQNGCMYVVPKQFDENYDRDSVYEHMVVQTTGWLAGKSHLAFPLAGARPLAPVRPLPLPPPPPPPPLLLLLLFSSSFFFFCRSEPAVSCCKRTHKHAHRASVIGWRQLFVSCLLDASEPAIVIVTLVWSSSRCAPDAGGGRLALRLVWQRDPLGCPLPRGSCRPAACFHRLGVPADRLRQPRCAPTEPRGGAGLDARSKAGATSTIDGLLSALDRSASSV